MAAVAVLSQVRISAPFSSHPAVAASHVTDDELVSEVLAHEGLVIVAGKSNPLHRKKRIKLLDLVDQPRMLLPDNSLPGAMARDFCRNQGLEPPRPSIITLSLQLNTAFVGAGPHLCVLPSSMLLFGAALPVDLPQPDSAIGVLTVRNRSLSPLAEAFLTIARAVGAGLDRQEQRVTRRRNPRG